MSYFGIFIFITVLLISISTSIIISINYGLINGALNFCFQIICFLFGMKMSEYLSEIDERNERRMNRDG